MDYVGIKEYTNMREMLALEVIRKRNKKAPKLHGYI